MRKPECQRRQSGGRAVKEVPGNWGWAMERPRSPCEVWKSLRQVGKAKGEVRKPKCQRKEH